MPLRHAIPLCHAGPGPGRAAARAVPCR